MEDDILYFMNKELEVKSSGANSYENDEESEEIEETLEEDKEIIEKENDVEEVFEEEKKEEITRVPIITYFSNDIMFDELEINQLKPLITSNKFFVGSEILYTNTIIDYCEVFLKCFKLVNALVSISTLPNNIKDKLILIAREYGVIASVVSYYLDIINKGEYGSSIAIMKLKKLVKTNFVKIEELIKFIYINGRVTKTYNPDYDIGYA